MVGYCVDGRNVKVVSWFFYYLFRSREWGGIVQNLSNRYFRFNRGRDSTRTRLAYGDNCIGIYIVGVEFRGHHDVRRRLFVSQVGQGIFRFEFVVPNGPLLRRFADLGSVITANRRCLSVREFKSVVVHSHLRTLWNVFFPITNDRRCREGVTNLRVTFRLLTRLRTKRSKRRGVARGRL